MKLQSIFVLLYLCLSVLSPVFCQDQVTTEVDVSKPVYWDPSSTQEEIEYIILQYVHAKASASNFTELNIQKQLNRREERRLCGIITTTLCAALIAVDMSICGVVEVIDEVWDEEKWRLVIGIPVEDILKCTEERVGDCDGWFCFCFCCDCVKDVFYFLGLIII
eukprot:GFUD01010848.1.p1 GENE.GFUD01010848.1~~GFUD01010848.1.p1  ORF type:complete len:164 (+),score=15.43 GFUD01010848.1:126-617(+)